MSLPDPVLGAAAQRAIEVPDADAVEQARPAVEDADAAGGAEVDPDLGAVPLEADPADALDQRRLAGDGLDDEDERR